MKLALVIPIYNEEASLPALLHSLSKLPPDIEVVCVDNGSRDRSRRILEHSPFHVHVLPENLGYGGGVQAGIAAAPKQATHIGWIPADGQYSIDDVLKVWNSTKANPQFVHKGRRQNRSDSFSQRVVSAVYSFLARRILHLPVRDFNGLPKIFPAKWLVSRSGSCRRDFLLDAELLQLAIQDGLSIVEHPVHFYRRASGQSSWSGKRLKVYLSSLRGLVVLSK